MPFCRLSLKLGSEIGLPRLDVLPDSDAPQPQASLLPQPQGISSLFQSFCSLSEE